MKQNDCFESFKFTADQVKSYFRNALKDLKIAEGADIAEVRFLYSYNALLKAGITLLAARKGVKVRNAPGHHIKTLEAIGDILKDRDIFAIANSMRMKRNTDLYAGGIIISDKESKDYLGFVKKIVKRIKTEIE
jgi:hypothetical protein